MTNKFFARASNRDYGFFAALLFFGIMAILFTFPIQEGDFFWHVRTGQWIWDHKSLPSADTFTHTNWFLKPTEHLERTRFFLKQYWLGQLAFFGVWKAGGEAGIVVLRATIYTGILVFIYWWLRRESAGIIPLVTVFAIGNVLVTFSNERPQIFRLPCCRSEKNAPAEASAGAAWLVAYGRSQREPLPRTGQR